MVYSPFLILAAEKLKFLHFNYRFQGRKNQAAIISTFARNPVRRYAIGPTKNSIKIRLFSSTMLPTAGSVQPQQTEVRRVPTSPLRIPPQKVTGERTSMLISQDVNKH